MHPEIWRHETFDVKKKEISQHNNTNHSTSEIHLPLSSILPQIFHSPDTNESSINAVTESVIPFWIIKSDHFKYAFYEFYNLMILRGTSIVVHYDIDRIHDLGCLWPRFTKYTTASFHISLLLQQFQIEALELTWPPTLWQAATDPLQR